MSSLCSTTMCIATKASVADCCSRCVFFWGRFECVFTYPRSLFIHWSHVLCARHMSHPLVTCLIHWSHVLSTRHMSYPLVTCLIHSSHVC
jgi:hypothetical protein